MLNELILPLVLATGQGDGAKAPDAKKVKDDSPFTITYAPAGRRSPFIPPSRFNEESTPEEKGEKFKADLGKLSAAELKKRLTQDLVDIRRFRDEGKLEQAYELTKQGNRVLADQQGAEFKQVRMHYESLFKEISKRIKVTVAEKRLLEMKIKISGIVKDDNGTQAILDGQTIVRAGDMYRGIKVSAIASKAIEFTINGVKLSQPFE